jgi:hypothetical protein
VYNNIVRSDVNPLDNFHTNSPSTRVDTKSHLPRMDTIERGVLRDTTKATDVEAGLAATKERYGSQSEDDTRETSRDGKNQK